MHTSDDESAEDFNLQITKIKRKRKAIVSSRQVFRRITEQLDSLVQQPCSNTSSVVQNDFHGIVDNARNVDVLATKFSNDYNDTNFTTGESSRLNSDQSFSAKNLDFDCPLCLSCSCVSCDICCHFDDCENCVHCIKCVEDVDDHFSDPEPKSSSEESDDPEVLSSDNLLARTIKNDFIAIIHKHNLNHTVVEDMMQFFRKHNVGKFPKTARTLLKTPLSVSIRTVPPGQYWHNGVTKYIKSFAEVTKCDKINIKFSYDSVPIANSSNASFSPISCQFNNSTHVYLIGVYFGSQKPTDTNDLLKDFVNEVIPLCENGFQFGNKTLRIKIICAICDAPAKSSLLKIRGHGAYFGCTKCHVEGEHIERRMSYADLTARLRTDQDFDDAEHDENATILSKIPSFGLVSCVPLDYMHLVLLGVMRKLVYMWLSGPLRVRLPGRLITEFSAAMEYVANCVPKDFVRKPRSIQYVKRFKATEYRQILLYTGPVVLANVLPTELYQHFLILHVAITILAHPKLCIVYNNYAHSLLVYFVETFIILYGRELVSHNVHGLIHLAADVNKFGPLDSFSSFPFENFYQTLKKLIRKGEKPLHQLARRYGEMEKTTTYRYSIVDNKDNYLFSGGNKNGPIIIEGRQSSEYNCCTMFGGILLDGTSEANNTCLLNDGSVAVIERFVLYGDTGNKVAIGRKFLVVQDLYSKPCKSSLLEIHFVRKLSQLETWPIEYVTRKCFRMPFQNGFAVIPLLHHEKLVGY